MTVPVGGPVRQRLSGRDASRDWHSESCLGVSTARGRHLIVDANRHIQRCTQRATTARRRQRGRHTQRLYTDGAAVWTLVALHTARPPMLAHAVVPAFVFNGTAN